MLLTYFNAIMAFDLLCTLSSSANAELCLRYWAYDDGAWQESLISLCRAFALTAESLEKQVSDNSVAYALKMRCKCCGMPEFAVTRAQYEQLARFTSRFARPCHNVKCELKRDPLDLSKTLKSLNQRADIIEEKLQKLRNQLRPFDYTSLSAVDAFYIYSILVGSIDDWYDSEIPANNTLSAKLAPTLLLTEQLYERLRSLSVIVPSVHSHLRSFNIAGGKGSQITYDPLRVSWTLAVDEDGHDKDQLMALLRNIIGSASEPSCRELRRSLVEHECINLIGSKFSRIKLRLNQSAESQLRSALEPIMRNFPAKAVIIIINEIFIDQRFWDKFKKTRIENAVSAVVAKLEQYANAMPRFKLSSDVSEPLNDQIILDGDSLMSSIFCQLFGKERNFVPNS
ncbi:hypothetical protein ACHAC9_18930 [Massilia sp. CMS3.1]|uniref:hypothetical protein n=1 Tax=Massilia sp. CMS3.1 TaxID=3373083 RepID=UPI003EE72213